MFLKIPDLSVLVGQTIHTYIQKPMQKISAHIFISYARQDGLFFAERLERDLEAQGMRIWRDKRNLNPNQDFSAELEKAIEASTHIVVCITADTKRNDSFVRREIGYALALQKPIIPLVMDGTLPPIHIFNITRIEFHHQAWDVAFTDLLTRLALPLTVYEQPTPPEDAFRNYLNKRYQEVVNFLDMTVFSLISLNTKSLPGQVAEVHRNLPMGFAALPVTLTKGIEDSPHEFSTLAEAFDYYGGRLLLLGEPGAGKTTTLMAYARDVIASRLADPTQPLPLLAAIATWDVQKKTPLAEWLAAQVPALKHEDITRLVESGRALLLLDGLDELGDERENPDTKERFDPRLRFIETLGLVGAHRDALRYNTPTIITCRIKDYKSIEAKIELNGAVTLQPLDDLQMAEYLQGFPDLRASVQSDKRLREMCRTPLLLSLFTYAFQGQSDKVHELHNLKDSPSELRNTIFRTYLERRYEHERLKPNTNLQYDIEELYRVLGHVAAMGRMGRPEPIDKIVFQKILFDKSESFIEQALRLHILVTIDKSTVQFIHLLLRYHFAVEPLIEILQKTDDEYIERSTIMDLVEIADARAVEPLMGYLDAYDREIRREAMRGLARIGGKQTVEQLIELFADVRLLLHEGAGSRDRMCDIAIEVVANMGTTAVEPLLAALGNENTSIRSGAARALGRIRDARAFDALLAALSDTSIRGYVAVALARIRDPRALEPLIVALQDADSYFRADAAFALGEMGDWRSVDPLILALNDIEGMVRAIAAEALGKIGDPRALEPLIAALRDTYEGAYGSTHRFAADALAKIDDPRAKEALRELEGQKKKRSHKRS